MESITLLGLKMFILADYPLLWYHCRGRRQNRELDESH